MYPIHTELVRNEPLGTEDKPDPLDHVKVLALSPVKTASRAEWAGSPSEHYVVTPLDEFGPNETIPEDSLQTLYTVEKWGDEEPPKKIELDRRRERLQQQATPEQVFAKAAREAETAKPRRGRPPAGDKS